MKSIHEILLLVKESFLTDRFSLCSAANKLNSGAISVISYSELLEFKNYLKSTIEDQEEFYDAYGNETDFKWKFVWPIKQVEPRIEWLDKHIELTSHK